MNLNRLTPPPVLVLPHDLFQRMNLQAEFTGTPRPLALTTISSTDGSVGEQVQINSTGNNPTDITTARPYYGWFEGPWWQLMRKGLGGAPDFNLIYEQFVFCDSRPTACHGLDCGINGTCVLGADPYDDSQVDCDCRTHHEFNGTTCTATQHLEEALTFGIVTYTISSTITYTAWTRIHTHSLTNDDLAGSRVVLVDGEKFSDCSNLDGTVNVAEGAAGTAKFLTGQWVHDLTENEKQFDTPKGVWRICMCYSKQILAVRAIRGEAATSCTNPAEFSEQIRVIESQGDEGPFPPRYRTDGEPTNYVQFAAEWRYDNHYYNALVHQPFDFCFWGKALTLTGPLRVTPVPWRKADTRDFNWMKFGRGVNEPIPPAIEIPPELLNWNMTTELFQDKLCGTATVEGRGAYVLEWKATVDENVWLAAQMVQAAGPYSGTANGGQLSFVSHAESTIEIGFDQEYFGTGSIYTNPAPFTGALALARGDCGNTTDDAMVRVQLSDDPVYVSNFHSAEEVAGLRYCPRNQAPGNDTISAKINDWAILGNVSASEVATECSRMIYKGFFQGSGEANICWCGAAACADPDADLSLFTVLIQSVYLKGPQVNQQAHMIAGDKFDLSLRWDALDPLGAFPAEVSKNRIRIIPGFADCASSQEVTAELTYSNASDPEVKVMPPTKTDRGVWAFCNATSSQIATLRGAYAQDNHADGVYAISSESCMMISGKERAANDISTQVLCEGLGLCHDSGHEGCNSWQPEVACPQRISKRTKQAPMFYFDGYPCVTWPCLSVRDLIYTHQTFCTQTLKGTVDLSSCQVPWQNHKGYYRNNGGDLHWHTNTWQVFCCADAANLQLEFDNTIHFFSWPSGLPEINKTSAAAGEKCAEKGLSHCTMDELGAAHVGHGPFGFLASIQMQNDPSCASSTCQVPRAGGWMRVVPGDPAYSDFIGEPSSGKSGMYSCCEKNAGIYHWQNKGSSQTSWYTHRNYCEAFGLRLCNVEEVCGEEDHKLWWGGTLAHRRAGTIFRAHSSTIPVNIENKWMELKWDWDDGSQKDCHFGTGVQSIGYFSDYSRIRYTCCPHSVAALPSSTVQKNGDALEIKNLKIHAAGHYKVCWCADTVSGYQRCSPGPDGTYARGYGSLTGGTGADHYMDLHVAGPVVKETPTLETQTVSAPFTVEMTSTKTVTDVLGTGPLTNYSNVQIYALTEADCYNISHGLYTTLYTSDSQSTPWLQTTGMTTENVPLEVRDIPDSRGVDGVMTFAQSAYYPMPKQVQMCWCRDNTLQSCTIALGDTIVRGLPRASIFRESVDASWTTPTLEGGFGIHPAHNPTPPRFWSLLEDPGSSSRRRLSAEGPASANITKEENAARKAPTAEIEAVSPSPFPPEEKPEKNTENDVQQDASRRRLTTSYVPETPEQFFVRDDPSLGKLWRNQMWRLFLHLDEWFNGFDFDTPDRNPHPHTAPFLPSDKVGVFAEPHTCGQAENAFPYLVPYLKNYANTSFAAVHGLGGPEQEGGAWSESRNLVLCFCPGTSGDGCDVPEKFPFYLGTFAFLGPQYRIIFHRPNQPLAVETNFRALKEDFTPTIAWRAEVMYKLVDIHEDCKDPAMAWTGPDDTIDPLLYCDPQRCSGGSCVDPRIETCTAPPDSEFTDKYTYGETDEWTQKLSDVPFATWGRIYSSIRVTSPKAICLYDELNLARSDKNRIADIILRGPVWEDGSGFSTPRGLVFPDGEPSTFQSFRVRVYGEGLFSTAHILFLPATEFCGQQSTKIQEERAAVSVLKKGHDAARFEELRDTTEDEKSQVEALSGYRPSQVITFGPMFLREAGAYKICYWDGDLEGLSYKAAHKVTNAWEIEPISPTSLQYCPPESINVPETAVENPESVDKHTEGP
uniref:Uncharacterized protein n=1 Tax=Chromera velia CCMP2878 TaxID=1169474 RepID=A0A0G4GGH5_9ALVE|eukprot:Cvel_21806.t1-p1 / transcript=Cvel_21806.t1 / gene=Cvel_21806 / organism=Chromera_velia_CCMP2878 / gene_product=hypothetical protein / transcript_product=hypothetical protein / location=Cvel_scaffold2078:15696-33913(+) / protein_length=1873 / sequence_SO=supercontig / SO=protein_coding / is_pseudo=false